MKIYPFRPPQPVSGPVWRQPAQRPRPSLAASKHPILDLYQIAFANINFATCKEHELVINAAKDLLPRPGAKKQPEVKARVNIATTERLVRTAADTLTENDPAARQRMTGLLRQSLEEKHHSLARAKVEVILLEGRPAPEETFSAYLAGVLEEDSETIIAAKENDENLAWTIVGKMAFDAVYTARSGHPELVEDYCKEALRGYLGDGLAQKMPAYGQSITVRKTVVLNLFQACYEMFDGYYEALEISRA